MRILRNYFLRDFFHNLATAFIGITFILLLGNLIKALDFIVRKGVDVAIAGKSFAYAIPYLLQYSLPLATLLAVLLCMGRFASDNEFVAIKVAGIPMKRILSIFLTVGMIISLLLIFMHSKIIPHAHFMSKKIIKEIGQSNPLGLIEPGVFVDSFDGFVLLTQDMEANVLKKVYIYQTDKKNANVIFANRGEFIIEEDVLKVKLEDGFIEGPKMKFRIKFQNHFMELPIAKNKIKINKKTKHLGFRELYDALQPTLDSELPHHIEKRKEILVEFNRKISLSFASIIFVILGFGIAGQAKPREKSVNLSIIFIAGLGYYLLSLLSTTLVMKNNFPIYFIWVPNAIFLIVGLHQTHKTCKI